jgi:hypothetical protein
MRPKSRHMVFIIPIELSVFTPKTHNGLFYYMFRGFVLLSRLSMALIYNKIHKIALALELKH